MNGYTIATYLRLSGEDRNMELTGKMESNSISNQRSLLSDYINRTPEFKGAVVLEYCDDGWSGKNFERPAVCEMLEQVKQGKIQCIIVKDLSRFGRDYLIVGNYIFRVFPFLNVRFIAINDSFDSAKMMNMDSLDASFKTMFHDFYSRDTSHKIRSAKQLRAQKGDFLSPYAFYGYKKSPVNKRQLVVDPEAAAVVRRVFCMAIDGVRPVLIAKRLNDEQVPTPMLYKRKKGCSRTVWPCVRENNFWTFNTIWKMLTDERYTGKNIYGIHVRDKIGKNHTVRQDKSNWIEVERTHEAIVTREEFHQAQMAFRTCIKRNEKVSGDQNRIPLHKKVRCGLCGHSMSYVNTRQPYFICRTSSVSDIYGCTGEHIPERDLVETVLAGLRAQARYSIKASRIWEERRCKEKKTEEAARKSILKLKEMAAGLENTIQELYEAYVFGTMGKDEYIAAKKSVVGRKKSIADQIKQLESECRVFSANKESEIQILSRIQQYAEIENLTVDITSEVLKEIIVYPDSRLDIVWNFQDIIERMFVDADEM